MSELSDKIALVTGASRGVGKGTALGLGEAGATVYITGRTTEEGRGAVSLAGTIHQTATEVDQLGGRGIAVQCDHRNDEEVKALFARIQQDQGRLDMLVNNVWGGYEHFNDGTEFWNERGFWTEPLSRWDKMFQAGVRAHYSASVMAVPMMIEQHHGLIVNISAPAKNDAGVAYGAAKAATNRMTSAMAHELREHNIAVIALYPGLVRTESVLNAGGFFDLSNSESPQFIGRIVAGLVVDSDIMQKSGQSLIAAALAVEYGIIDIDGTHPQPMTIEEW